MVNRPVVFGVGRFQSGTAVLVQQVLAILPPAEQFELDDQPIAFDKDGGRMRG